MISNTEPTKNLSKANRTKYPIFECIVQGRIISPTAPTKKKPKGGFKERSFKMHTSVKFDNKGITPVNKRTYLLYEKYGYTKKDAIEFDNIEKLRYMSYTYIRD